MNLIIIILKQVLKVFVFVFLSNSGKELIIYGEMSKWVPWSRQRMSNIETRGVFGMDGQMENLRITLQGAVDEVIEFYMAWGGDMMEFKCVVPVGGSVVIDVAQKKCVNE